MSRVSPAGRFAGFVADLTFDDLLPETIDRAKLLILDSIGCAFGAARTLEGQRTLALAASFSGSGDCSIIGDDARLSVDKAAFTNAQLANLLDFDDSYDFYQPGHPGCRIVPSSLAVGESVEADGRQCITAVVAAYEVAMRVGRAMGSVLWTTGLPPLASPIGPATASASLMGLDREIVEEGFRILNLEIEMDARPPTTLKIDIHANTRLGSLKGNVGKAAASGIFAMQKAASELSGIPGLLDGDQATWEGMGLPADGFGQLERQPDDRFLIHDVSLKPTPSCRFAHAPMTAFWDALNREDVAAESIAKIVVHGVKRLSRYECPNMIAAQTSTPMALALALLGGEAGPAWYAEERFLMDDVQRLAAKVEFRDDPGAATVERERGRMTSRVSIVLNDGREIEGACNALRGSPRNALSADDIVRKFVVNTAHLDRQRRDVIVDQVMGLDDLGALANLSGSLGSAPRG